METEREYYYTEAIGVDVVEIYKTTEVRWLWCATDELQPAYHVVLDVRQLIELFLALDRVGVVRVELVDGVFALDAHVFGQLVGPGYVDLQALGYLVGQFVENVDGPLDRGQAQPAHFGQLHVDVVGVNTAAATAAAGHIDIDRHRRGRGQQQIVVVVVAPGRDVVVVVGGRQ